MTDQVHALSEKPRDGSMGLTRGLTRRTMLQWSAAGAAALGAQLAFPRLLSATSGGSPASAEQGLYSELLQTWCDGMLARQVTSLSDLNLHGGLLCPACGLIHGRCGDSIYPFLRMAHATGNQGYLKAALMVYDWSERTVSRADGSWVNDVSLSPWKGITVFRAIALAEALQHHGAILETAVRKQWTDRLARAAKFLDGFISIETGNINYPVTSTLAFVLCGQVLGDTHYLHRGQKLAHEVLAQFTPDGFLFGEGHPLRGITPKGCRPVDLGYNVEESLPSLGLYAVLMNDQTVLDQVVAAFKTHLEFMLPDGAWDNSWGTRNYKWSWWGSRTSDGCHSGLVLLSKYEPRFREAARRNAELMASCTHDGLLYGGPDYRAHGDPACIHHTFTHAKSLAAVLDRGEFPQDHGKRPELPRDEAYGLKTFSVIGTRLAAIGPWRATVTEYDWDYVEDVQSGSGGAGSHASGGALSILYHRVLGPLFTASMTQYRMIEISNQQQYRDGPTMALIPRIEFANGDETYMSCNDYKAVVKATQDSGEVVFTAEGQMQTAARKPMKEGDLTYRMVYRLSERAVELAATVNGRVAGAAPLRLILPLVSRADEQVEQPDPQRIQITKPQGTLHVYTDAAEGFEAIAKTRVFNLVPGFECLPVSLVLPLAREMHIRLEA
jgi:hypothetical protein